MIELTSELFDITTLLVSKLKESGIELTEMENKQVSGGLDKISAKLKELQGKE